MTESSRPDSIPDDENEALADLERLAESGSQPDPATLSGSDCRIFEAFTEHCRLYQFFDQLAAPVRLALGVDELPPDLPEYESLDEIGRGGMGIVYRGLHRKLRRMDAIKVIRSDKLRSENPESVRQMQSRFERELRLAAYIAHENIVPVYQVGEAHGRLWFSMQLVEGISLQELRGHADTATEQIVSVLERIARAVDRLHRHGVIHGDIKPHNILIEQHSGRPLITDFGLAEFASYFHPHDAESANHLTTDSIAGTPAYMAPELLHAAMSQATPQDAALIRSVSSDIYSLGATLWATLTGRSPIELKETQKTFHFASIPLPPELLEICRKAMSLNPASRHQSARVFADDLAHWLNRPRWNRHFPGLRHLLWMIVAPWMIVSNVIVWFMLRKSAGEAWIWSMILSNYAPLFVAFFMGQNRNRESHSARRELWSIWIGHALSSVAGLIGLRILPGANSGHTLPAFYCLWAAISAVAFFAKSGNFWPAYRWIGICWCVIAVAIASMPGCCSILFGCCAALTCLVIARGDKAFAETD